MGDVIDVAVPRKGRPLEAVLKRLAARTGATELADSIASTLRYEKAITKGDVDPDSDVYARLREYSDPADPTAPDYTLVRDDREGLPRRIVFDSVEVPVDDARVRLVGREEPFRALRKHEVALGFDSADLVLEEVVDLDPEPLSGIDDLNRRIDPHDTDVRVVTGLGDSVTHTLLATPGTARGGPVEDLDREFVAEYEGPVCVSPRYERLVEAVLGTRATRGIEFVHPPDGEEMEAAIAEVGLGVYITVTGSTAREHGLVVGEGLFESETVLFKNVAEADATTDRGLSVFRETAASAGVPAR